jgi:phosphoglycerate dehydrogenase-like enzyme
VAKALEAVAARAPRDAEVVELDDTTDLSRLGFIVPASQPDALPPGLAHAEAISVVQVLSAGTDWIEDRLPPQATLCSARGARDAPVAEWIMGALLGTSTRVLEGARARAWSSSHVIDLSAWRVLIVGMGSIGQAVADRLAPFGSEVIGVASRARDGMHGIEELPELLPAADAVVVLAPLSESTVGLIGAAELRAMRDGALLVNAARGPVVDADALLAETATGRLKAVLDVTDPEPLPEEHGLWRAPGVLSITPHIAGNSPRGEAAAAALAGEQFARWCAGEPLHNVIRSGRG